MEVFSPDKRTSIQSSDLSSLSKTKPRLPTSYITESFTSQQNLNFLSNTPFSQRLLQSNLSTPSSGINLSQNLRQGLGQSQERPQLQSQSHPSPPIDYIVYHNSNNNSSSNHNHNHNHSYDHSYLLSPPYHTSQAIEPSESGLIQKLVSDQLKNSQNKALEQRLRDELRQQQESYENDILNSEKQTKIHEEEMKKAIDVAIEENNKKWEIVVNEKNDMIENLQLEYERDVKDVEDKWAIQIYELEQKYKADKESYANVLRVERQAYEFELANRFEAKEEVLKESYEKKLKKYEKQIMESEQAYRTKSTTVEEILKEARLEWQSVKQSYESRETSLKEEIALKDMRLTSVQRRLDEIDDINKALQEWKTIATELSALCIRACAKANELPDLAPEILIPQYNDPKYSKNTKTGWVFSTTMVDPPEINEEFIIEYNILRKKSLAIERKTLVKLLKYSKRVIELSESLTQPIDVIGASKRLSPDKIYTK